MGLILICLPHLATVYRSGAGAKRGIFFILFCSFLHIAAIVISLKYGTLQKYHMPRRRFSSLYRFLPAALMIMLGVQMGSAVTPWSILINMASLSMPPTQPTEPWAMESQPTPLPSRLPSTPPLKAASPTASSAAQSRSPRPAFICVVTSRWPTTRQSPGGFRRHSAHVAFDELPGGTVNPQNFISRLQPHEYRNQWPRRHRRPGCSLVALCQHQWRKPPHHDFPEQL